MFIPLSVCRNHTKMTILHIEKVFLTPNYFFYLSHISQNKSWLFYSLNLCSLLLANFKETRTLV